jgi:hypothetical protein
MLRLRRRTGFYTAYMPTRDELHKQIDDLTEEQLAGTRLDVPVRAATWGNLSAMKRRSARRKMKRLTEEEIAANGQTLAEAWGYESSK